MRPLLLTLSVAVACVALAQPADAQIRFGVQGAVMTGLEDLSATPSATDLNGTFGLGARAALQPPLMPIGLVAQGVYYFPDGDGSYSTYSLAAQLRLPTPLVSPYAIGGWQWRRSSSDSGTGTSFSNTESGLMVGVGLQVNVAMALFFEVTFEFNDEIAGLPDFDVSPIVIKGGLMFG